MRDFADFAVLPDDHRQAALAKFEALSPSSAAVSLGGDTHPFRHFLLKNRFERLSYSRVHWLLEKVRDRESHALPRSKSQPGYMDRLLAAARRWHDPVHPEIFDDLAVVIERVSWSKGGLEKARSLPATTRGHRLHEVGAV